MTHLSTKSALEYLLDKVDEEACEISQAVKKIKNFGFQSVHTRTGLTNLQELQLELTDLLAVTRMLNAELINAGLEPLTIDDEEGIVAKMEKVARFSSTSVNAGVLTTPLEPYQPRKEVRPHGTETNW